MPPDAGRVNASCGNHDVEGPDEVCDDGNAADADYCSADCKEVTGSCGDGVLQRNETCDPAIEAAAIGCGDAERDGESACLFPRPGFECQPEPPACEAVSVSGQPDADERIHPMSFSGARALCAWVDREMLARQPQSGTPGSALGTGWFCGSSIESGYRIVWDQAGQCLGSPEGEGLLGAAYYRVLARCRPPVNEFEQCWLAIAQNPCAFIGRSGAFVTTCFEQSCDPLDEGEVCADHVECQDEQCCGAADDEQRRCSSAACVYGELGDPCVGAAYCSSGNCAQGRCVPTEATADVGESCSADHDCFSNLCSAGLCRAELGAQCAEDSECLTDECCPYASGPRCAYSEQCRAIGSFCEDSDDCIEGMCLAAGDGRGFCTKPCTSHADCGTNLNFFNNFCVEASTGAERYCHPGCSVDAECQALGGCECGSAPECDLQSRCAAEGLACVTGPDDAGAEITVCRF